MRVETREITWFTLPELKERDANAYEKALDNLRRVLWDGGDYIESIANDIVYEFGKRVGDASVERFGEGDYPGVAGVELKNWAVADRSAHVGFEGTLTEESAPGLPWHEWLESVTLHARTGSTEIVVNDSDEAPYIGYNVRRENYDEEQERLYDLREAMRDAVWEALSEALAGGERSAEFADSEENLLELAEANEWEFDQHGVMA
jgi:hypothetical protein